MFDARRLLLATLVALGALAALASGSGQSHGAPCAVGLASRLAATGAARQLLTVVAPTTTSTSGSFSAWQRSGACWKLVAGPWSATLGANGVSSHHHEGDGTTPEGAYGIGPVMYGVAPDPGVHYRFERLRCGDWWDEDPTSAAYNTFVALGCGQQPSFGGDSEALWRSPAAYAYFALIDYNTAPIVPGRGSAIFLHVAVGAPTAGCVALAPAELVEVLRWLRPGLSPLIVIGTRATIARY